MRGLIGDRLVMAERGLVRALGLAEAVTLQQVQWHIVDCADGRDHDGEQWFPITFTALSDELGLSVDQTRRAVRTLQERGLLLSCQPEGWSSRRKWYRIDYEAVHAVISPDACGDSAASTSGDSAASPTSQPLKPARTRARTQRDDYFDVLVAVYGQPTPRSGAAFYSRVVTDVMAMPDATPDELRRRALLARQRYGKKSTPEAVVKHWPMLAQQSSRFDQWAEHAHQEGTTC